MSDHSGCPPGSRWQLSNAFWEKEHDMQHRSILGSVRRMGATLAAAAVLAPLGFTLQDCATDPPCISSGTAATVTFTRPSLLTPGTPVGAIWSSGTGDPQAFDEDPALDDLMGDGIPGSPPTTASVIISNFNGDLSGPNGVTVNGGTDGDCIEVYMRWTYLYQETVTHTTISEFEFKPGGMGSGSGTSQSTSVTYWRAGYKFSCKKDVCPC